MTNATVIKPYLQLQGYVNEPLVTLTYDLTNAAGLLTNEMAAVVDQHFDTNQFDFTTNSLTKHPNSLPTSYCCPG